jgi:hypothetical protein
VLIHSTSVVLTPNSFWMVGMATLTMLMSSTDMNMPIEMTHSARGQLVACTVCADPVVGVSADVAAEVPVGVSAHVSAFVAAFGAAFVPVGASAVGRWTPGAVSGTPGASPAGRPAIAGSWERVSVLTCSPGESLIDALQVGSGVTGVARQAVSGGTSAPGI